MTDQTLVEVNLGKCPTPMTPGALACGRTSNVRATSIRPPR